MERVSEEILYARNNFLKYKRDIAKAKELYNNAFFATKNVINLAEKEIERNR